jgi:hypothetical protein
MKKLALTVLAGMVVSLGAHAQSDLFSTIQNWTGTGANEAALEIDWNNGTSGDALVWGYRWDGTATAEQMIDAILTADPHLYAEVSGPTMYGTETFGFGYQQAGDGNFLLSPALSFNSQHLAIVNDTDVKETRTPSVAGDRWEEGWFNNYWGYDVSTDLRLAVDYTDWDYAPDGISEVTLNNGDVEGFVYSAGADITPGVPLAAPVPEPSTWAMLGMGGLAMVYRRKKS